jgi:hypothetical protein
MTTENTDYEAPESGARIEELPASDMQMRGEDRERPSPLRAPPGGESEDPEDVAAPPEDPEDPEDFQRQAPPPRDPDDE